MTTAKVAISLDEKTLSQLDRLVKRKVFPNRSKAIQIAIDEKIHRLESNQFERECAKLNPLEEQAMADEGLAGELSQWPEY